MRSEPAAAAAAGGAWIDAVSAARSSRGVRALPLNSVAEPEIVAWAWAVYGRVDSTVRPSADDERSTRLTRLVVRGNAESDGRVLTVRVEEAVSMQRQRRASGIMHTVVLSRRRDGRPSMRRACTRASQPAQRRPSTMRHALLDRRLRKPAQGEGQALPCDDGLG